LADTRRTPVFLLTQPLITVVAAADGESVAITRLGTAMTAAAMPARSAYLGREVFLGDFLLVFIPAPANIREEPPR
jgi:ligand-binding SRPBCC domain-containing protein